MYHSHFRPALLTCLVCWGTASVWASDVDDAEVTLQLLPDVLKSFDGDLKGGDGRWQLTIVERPVVVVTDARAGRMRIMTPVAESEGLSPQQLRRLMQANFESALDARYAIANGMVWSVFIHPLGPLRESQVVSAIAQTLTLAETYGSTFSSGALSYGGGDHASELFRSLRDRATPL